MRVLLLALAGALCAARVGADDWPTYRHDAARSGVTRERLAPPLRLQWTFRPRRPPLPSWPDPKREKPRVRFDDAFHVAVAGGRVFFGSSSEDYVAALEERQVIGRRKKLSPAQRAALDRARKALVSARCAASARPSTPSSAGACPWTAPTR